MTLNQRSRITALAILFIFSINTLFPLETDSDAPTLFEQISTLITYTIKTQESTRSDHQLWHQLATPVCQSLVDNNTMRPLTNLKNLTAKELQNIDLLISFGEQQDTFPTVVQTALQALKEQYRCPRRIPGFEHQSFSASAVTEMMKRSHISKKRQRVTQTEHKKMKRLEHEAHSAKRKELRMKRHVTHQAGRFKYHTATDMLRERNRNAQESRQLRKRRRESQKKVTYANKHRESYAAEQQRKMQEERKRREQAQKEILQKKNNTDRAS